MAHEIEVPDRAFDYLVNQRGRISELRDNRAAWIDAYRDSLAEDMVKMFRALPRRCESILDIGGGMGGINVLLTRHYAERSQPDPRVTILDGDQCGIDVVRSDRPHSDMATANDFLMRNGLWNVRAIRADLAADFVGRHPALGPRGADLVISLAAWCFHIEPAAYIPFVSANTAPGAVIIVEMRRAKPSWHDQMHKAFGQGRFLIAYPKFEMWAFRHDK